MRAGKTRFEALHESPPPPNSVVFAGSSTFSQWHELATDLRGIPVCNAAFCDATTRDLLAHSRDLAALQPRVLVLYVGAADAERGLPAEEAAANVCALCAALRATLHPRRLPVVYVSALHAAPGVRAAGGTRAAECTRLGALVAARCGDEAGDPDTLVVDLNERPFASDPASYGIDGAHLARAGQRSLGEALRPVVAQVFADAVMARHDSASAAPCAAAAAPQAFAPPIQQALQHETTSARALAADDGARSTTAPSPPPCP